MRKHFLILMLLALLPFTAWAAAPIEHVIGGYTYTRSADVVLSTATPTAPTITIKKGTSELYNGVSATICDANKNVLASFANPAGGLYYELVNFPDGTQHKSLYVPFYVADELAATLVNTKDLYDASLAEGGAYWYYYQEWKRSDVWYHWAETTTDLESDGVLLMPGDQPDPTAADHVDESGRLISTSPTYREDAEAWYDALKAGTYGNKISHSWWAAKASKPANYAFSFHTAAADEAWKVAVSYDNAPVVFPWGDRVFGSQEGQKHYGLYSVNGPVVANVDIKHDFNVEPTAFDATKFKMYLYPTATLPDAVFVPVYVTVAPANVQFDYGTAIPQNGTTATEDMIGNVSNLGDFTKAQIAEALTFTCNQTITDAKNYVYDLTIKENYNDIPGLENLNLTVTGGSGQLKVVPKTLTADMIAAIPAETYSGEKKTPTPVVSYLSDPTDPTSQVVTLVAGEHFTYSYGEANDNINAGAGAGIVTITAIANTNYQGSASAHFDIDKLALTTVTVAPIAPQTYKFGAPIKPTLTVTSGNYTLTANDYNVIWNNNTDATTTGVPAPTGTLSAATDGNFTFADKNDLTFVINPKSLADTDIAIANIGNQTYAGSALTPVATVNWTIGADAHSLNAFVDFTYSNNTVVGTAKVTAKAKSTATNYTGETQKSFSILPGSIADATITITNPDAVVYNGEEQHPAFTVTLGGALLTKDKDYAIDKWVNAKNATTTDSKAKVVIKGIGNFDAVNPNGDPITKEQKFDINKRVLTITATNVETNFGLAPVFAKTTNVVGTEDIGGTYTLTVYDGTNVVAEANYNALEVSTGRYTYKYTWAANPKPNPLPAGKTAADYDSEAQEAARANYNLTFVAEPGNITVNPATLAIIPVNKTKKYGAVDPALTYQVLNGTTDVTADVVFTTAPTLTRAEGENVADGPFAISVSNKTAVAATGYTFTFPEDGYLTITPFHITVTANNQKILYGSEPNTTTGDDSWVKDVNNNNEEVNGTKLTVTFSPAMTGTGLITREMLQLSLDWDGDATVGNHGDALTPAINNPNFDAEIVSGSVNVVAGNILILDRNKADLANDIKAYDGETGVTVKFAARSIAKDTWYPMVLPFSTTVAEFSRNIGYAVVNRIDATKNDDDIHLKLHMTDLPANKPFLFKVGEDGVNLNDVNFKFTNVEIDWVANEVEDADLKGNALVGTYVSKNAFTQYEWYRTASGWSQGPVTLTNPLLPLSAFVRMKSPASSARILIEEPDGSTTAINVVTGEQQNFAKGAWYTIDGVMVNGIPTAKGVYIQNGKKVVIK